MGRDVALSHAVMHDGIMGTRAEGERSGVGKLCNLFVLRNKALSLYSVRLSISTSGSRLCVGGEGYTIFTSFPRSSGHYYYNEDTGNSNIMRSAM